MQEDDENSEPSDFGSEPSSPPESDSEPEDDPPTDFDETPPESEFEDDDEPMSPPESFVDESFIDDSIMDGSFIDDDDGTRNVVSIEVLHTFSAVNDKHLPCFLSYFDNNRQPDPAQYEHHYNAELPGRGWRRWPAPG